MPRYSYKGGVKVFDDLVAEHWEAETIAPSAARAKSNITYQFKKQMGLERNVKVTLEGKIEKTE